MSGPQVALLEDIMTALERNGQGGRVIHCDGADADGKANTSSNRVSEFFEKTSSDEFRESCRSYIASAHVYYESKQVTLHFAAMSARLVMPSWTASDERPRYELHGKPPGGVYEASKLSWYQGPAPMWVVKKLLMSNYLLELVVTSRAGRFLGQSMQRRPA